LNRISFLLVLALLLTGPAHAIDDRFNPHRYEKGGFAPVQDEAYQKECGSCHFAYLPGMLPERSWHLILNAKGHFGETLALDPQVAAKLEAYLTANAADRSPYRGAELMLDRLPASSTPARITELPIMQHRHVVIRQLMISGQAKVKTLTNCDACHEKAATGSFAYDEIVVPGVTKIVRPGGMF
jgi:hypothetical protein